MNPIKTPLGVLEKELKLINPYYSKKLLESIYDKSLLINGKKRFINRFFEIQKKKSICLALKLKEREGRVYLTHI